LGYRLNGRFLQNSAISFLDAGRKVVGVLVLVELYGGYFRLEMIWERLRIRLLTSKIESFKSIVLSYVGYDRVDALGQRVEFKVYMNKQDDGRDERDDKKINHIVMHPSTQRVANGNPPPCTIYISSGEFGHTDHARPEARRCRTPRSYAKSSFPVPQPAHPDLCCGSWQSFHPR